MRVRRLYLWLLVAAGLIAAAFSVQARVRAERSNRAVELVLDYNGVLDYCEAQGLSVPDTLKKMRALGITSIAYGENNVERLRRSNRLNYYAGTELARALRSRTELKPAGITGLANLLLDPTHMYVLVYDPQLKREIKGYLSLFLGKTTTTPFGPAIRHDSGDDVSPLLDRALHPSPNPSLVAGVEASARPLGATSPGAGRSAEPPVDPEEGGADDEEDTPSASASPALHLGERAAPGASALPTPGLERWRVFPSEAAVRADVKKSTVTLEVATSEHGLLETSLGFSRTDLDVAAQAGLHIWLRPENRGQFTDHDIRAFFSIMSKMHPRGLIFSGGSNEIVGYPDNLKTTVDSMKSHGMLYGAIEVPTLDAAQKGSRTLGVDLAPRTVRVMSFSPAFQVKLTPNDLVDKYMLGIRERNIRVVYLRFLTVPDPGQSLVSTNEAYFKALVDSIHHAGFTCGPSQPFAPLTPPAWAQVLMALAVVAGTLLLDRLLKDLLAPYEQLMLVSTPIFVLFLVGVGRGALCAKLLALTAGLVYPTLAVLVVLPPLLDLDRTASSPLSAMSAGIRLLSGSTLLSLGGGLLIAGLLASTPFMLSTDQARGIKLIMLVPPALVMLSYLRNQSTSSTPIWDVLSTRMAFWHAGAMGLFVIAAAIFIVRTGNAAPGAASDLEIQTRSWLENILVARPRFKEFAFGHPALIIAAVLIWERQRRSLLWLPILCFAIGQADVADTFCHIHTPYLISLLRVFHGWWLGLVVGVGAGMLTLRLLWRGTPSPSTEP